MFEPLPVNGYIAGRKPIRGNVCFNPQKYVVLRKILTCNSKYDRSPKNIFPGRLEKRIQRTSLLGTRLCYTRVYNTCCVQMQRTRSCDVILLTTKSEAPHRKSAAGQFRLCAWFLRYAFRCRTNTHPSTRQAQPNSQENARASEKNKRNYGTRLGLTSLPGYNAQLSNPPVGRNYSSDSYQFPSPLDPSSLVTIGQCLHLLYRMETTRRSFYLRASLRTSNFVIYRIARGRMQHRAKTVQPLLTVGYWNQAGRVLPLRSIGHLFPHTLFSVDIRIYVYYPDSGRPDLSL